MLKGLQSTTILASNSLSIDSQSQSYIAENVANRDDPNYIQKIVTKSLV